MYYEAREHSTVPAENAEDAVRAFVADPCRFRCPVWPNTRGERIVLIPDGHINEESAEIAVINLDTMHQLESLTFAWMDGIDEKIAHVIKAQDIEPPAMGTVTSLCIDGEGEGLASFTCSCCGEWFQSTIAVQKKHDQDAGYGMCPKCIHWIASS